MRLLRPALLALTSACTLAACGSGASELAAPDQRSEADPAAFPVEVEHQLGTSRIADPPERIVTVGLRDQDFALALGVTPIGTTEWFAEQPGAIWPWASDEVEGAAPEVIGASQDLNFEAIARLEPDLILGLYSGMSDRTYETLSRIAPTVADVPGYEDYTAPWQVQLELTARALGREQLGAEVTATVEAQIAEVAARHPEWEGLTVAYGGLADVPGVYTSGDQRGRLLEALGFDVPGEIDSLATTPGAFLAEFSREDFRLLDQDVAIIGGVANDPADLPGDDPLYGRLDALADGRVIAFDERESLLSGALSFSSPLSLPAALEELEPRLGAATDGDPSTEVAPAADVG